jgi:hypothetical protein
MSDMEEDAGVPGDAGEDEFAGLPEVRAQEVLILLSGYPAGCRMGLHALVPMSSSLVASLCSECLLMALESNHSCI